MTYSHLQITLSDEEQEALTCLAKRERRPIKDQAALLVLEGLEQRGLLIYLDKHPSPDNSPTANKSLSAGD
jgi:hypothetical protein